MDIIFVIVLLALVAAPLALLSGWFVDAGYASLGSLVNRGDKAWFHASMPWPRGVQEEDGVTWHIRAPDVVARSPETHQFEADDLEIGPARPQPRVGFREPPTGGRSRR
jgi:hypothetical protein